MADEIAVPTAKIAELLGLPPDTPESELRQAMADLLAAHEAREADAIAAAAEQRLQAEDKRIVAAAINDGRLPADRATFWLDACKRDRTTNRAVISMLAKGLPPAAKVAADADLQRVHGKVMAGLGLPTNPLRSVEAAGGFGQQPGETLPAPYRNPACPAPVVIQKGTSPADWTPKQTQDAMLRRLGPRFFPGTEPPPKGDVVYVPSPNDVSAWDEASGTWIEKQPYREIP